MGDLKKKSIIFLVVLIGIIISSFGMHQANIAKSVSRIVFEAAHQHNWFWADGWFELLMQFNQQTNQNNSDLIPLTKSFRASMEMTECFSSLRNADGDIQEKRIIKNFVRVFKFSENQAKQIVWITKRYSSVFLEIPLMMKCTDHGTQYSTKTIELLSNNQWYTKKEDFKLIYKNMKEKEKQYSDLSYQIFEKADKLFLLFFMFFCSFVGLLFFSIVRGNHKNAQQKLKNTNRILHEKEQSLRHAQAIAQIGSWEWNVTDDSFIFSDEMYRIYGIDSANQFLSIWTIMEQAIHPNDKDHVIARAKETWQTGKSEKLSYRIVHQDGDVRWIESMPPEVKETKNDDAPLCIIGTIQDVTEWKQTEDKIKQLSQFRELIIDNANIWLNVLDEKANVIFWNKAAESISGYTKEEVVGHGRIWEWSYPEKEYREKIIAKAAEIIEKNEVLEDFETTIQCKDGEKRNISWYSRNLTNNQGDLIGSIALGRDITEHKRFEQTIKKNEKFLRTIYEAADNVAFVVTDLAGKDTKILDVSPGAEKIFQYNREEVIGKKVAIFHPQEIVEDFPKMQAELLEHKKGYSGETVLVRKSGEQFSALFTIHPKFDVEGNIDGTIGVSIDITERKIEEERYRKTIESSIDGFWIVNTRGSFLEVNKAYSNMIGYSRDELLKMSIMDIEAVEHPEETRKRIEKIVRIGSDQFESRHRHKEGYIIDVEVSATYTQDSGGLFFVFLRDITNRKQMEERLRQAQKMESIGNLAGGIAHDFNNLLCPIIGMSEMLLEDLPDDSLEHENAKEIFSAGKRAGDLVNQILAFSRQSEHKMVPVRVQNVLKEVLKLSRSTIPTNIELQQNIQQNCGLVKADPSQIHQVAMNLITNAFHAVEEKNGVIDVEFEEITLQCNELPDIEMQSGQYVRLTVSDNGIGMSQNTIHNIFEPYFTTKERGKGTGLGLAVVYGIVKEHSGDIKVYSEIGRGTTFNIYLPLMKKTSEIAAITQVEGTAIGTESILLVDDEVSVAKLEAQMLSRLGYQVTVETDSNEALSSFTANPNFFDLVISDMTMPNMTGDQLAKKILSIQPETPIVICTGFSERINKEQAEMLGVKGFLMKPVVKSDMAQMIRNVLDEVKK
ncbi:MAG: PAS domain S-box protein [Desulfobacteraceae bacterium]|nr:PAS domain S-box protein [Desulfobacteraceae bacterium]